MNYVLIIHSIEFHTEQNMLEVNLITLTMWHRDRCTERHIVTHRHNNYQNHIGYEKILTFTILVHKMDASASQRCL